MSDLHTYQSRQLLRKAAEEVIELGAELLKLSNKKITRKRLNSVISEYNDVKSRMCELFDHCREK